MKSFLSLFLFFLYAVAAPVTLSDDPVVTHKVTFTIAHDDEVLGDVEISLFGTIAPITVQNFLSHVPEYKDTIFHRIIPNFMLQGGQLARQVRPFKDENFELKHDRPGRLSMANAGRNTNGSQFFITTVVTDWLDGRQFFFCQVTQGMDIIMKLQNVARNAQDKPLKDVKIVESKSTEVELAKEPSTDVAPEPVGVSEGINIGSEVDSKTEANAEARLEKQQADAQQAIEDVKVERNEIYILFAIVGLLGVYFLVWKNKKRIISVR